MGKGKGKYSTFNRVKDPNRGDSDLRRRRIALRRALLVLSLLIWLLLHRGADRSLGFGRAHGARRVEVDRREVRLLNARHPHRLAAARCRDGDDEK